MTNNYEAVIVFSVKNGEDQAKALEQKFAELITANGVLAEENGVDEWGVRKLAYEIDYEGDGFYVLYNFSCEPEFPSELDRVLKITDGVLRSMLVRKEG